MQTPPIIRKLLLVLPLVFITGTPAQEFSFLTGGMSTVKGNETSYAWQLDYHHDLGRYVAWSAAWLNEGHTVTHHRDGVLTQVWGHLLSSDRIELAVGAGEYRFFDTQLLATGNSINVHGWTPIYSVATTYYTDSRWFFRMIANRTNRSHGIATNTLVLGAGYELGKEGARTYTRGMWETKRTPAELTAFYGKSIVNTGVSEKGVASAVELRKGIAKNFDWTLSWINEGDPKIIRRNGLAAQAWAVDEYAMRRLSLGFGAGAYWYFDRKRRPLAGKDSQGNIAGLLSPTVAYRFSPEWLARLTWNRVVSDYNRDADVILVGLGYRWGHDLQPVAPLREGH